MAAAGVDNSRRGREEDGHGEEGRGDSEGLHCVCVWISAEMGDDGKERKKDGECLL